VALPLRRSAWHPLAEAAAGGEGGGCGPWSDGSDGSKEDEENRDNGIMVIRHSFLLKTSIIMDVMSYTKLP